MAASSTDLFIRKRYRLMKWLAPLVAPLPLPLDILLRLSGSDKERQGGHHYGQTYRRLFSPMKYHRLTLLEIGVGAGESLAVWQCYFPYAKIVAGDIQNLRHLATRRARVHMLDQGSANDLSTLASEEGPFDIIIDDGSHINAHQILSFKTLFAHLSSGGIYVIEDVQTSYWPEYGGKPVNQQDLSTCMGYFTELAKYLNYAEFRSREGVDSESADLGKAIDYIFFQHNLIVIRKLLELA